MDIVRIERLYSQPTTPSFSPKTLVLQQHDKKTACVYFVLSSMQMSQFRGLLRITPQVSATPSPRKFLLNWPLLHRLPNTFRLFFPCPRKNAILPRVWPWERCSCSWLQHRNHTSASFLAWPNVATKTCRKENNWGLASGKQLVQVLVLIRSSVLIIWKPLQNRETFMLRAKPWPSHQLSSCFQQHQHQQLARSTNTKQATPFPPPPITLPLQNQSSYYNLTSILQIPSLEPECPEEAHVAGGSPTVPRTQLIGKTVSVAGRHDVTACFTSQPLVAVLALDS